MWLTSIMDRADCSLLLAMTSLFGLVNKYKVKPALGTGSMSPLATVAHSSPSFLDASLGVTSGNLTKNYFPSSAYLNFIVSSEGGAQGSVLL